MSDPYSVGLATVANGATAVTGTDTFWVGKVRKNDMFFVPAQGLQARVTTDPTDNDALAITAWAGTSLVDAAYEIIPASDTTTSAARLRDLLAQMSVIEANGRGLFYRFSDSVTDADPGSGYLRLNNATIGSATAAYIDNLDANGATVSAVLDSWDDQATAAARGQLWLRSVADPTAFHAFKVSGSVQDGTGYRKLTLTDIGGSSTFAADDEMMVMFSAQGADGTNAILGVWQGAWVTATAYDVDDLVEQGGSTYICIEAHTSGTFATDLAAAKWELAIAKGDIGNTGSQGEKGWSPQIVVVSDGARRVHQLAGYVGGAGSAPTANVGDYLKGDGTFTATIGDAADVRGPAGADGAGTVAGLVAGPGISINASDPTLPVISMASGIGQCRLVKDGSNIRLNPHNGNLLKIDGVLCTIPDAGVALPPTGIATGAAYYVYAVATAGVVTSLEVTGGAPVVSTAVGNKGTMIRTGFESRTLVGMVYLTAGPVFVDTAEQRFVLSYFNRRSLNLQKSITADQTTSSTTYVNIPGLVAEFLSWGDERTDLAFNGAVYHTVGGAGKYIFAVGTIDGVNQSDGGGVGEVVGAASYSPMAFDFSAVLSAGYHIANIQGRTSVNTMGFAGGAGYRCAVRGCVRG